MTFPFQAVEIILPFGKDTIAGGVVTVKNWFYESLRNARHCHFILQSRGNNLTDPAPKKSSRIQRRNRTAILDAALEVFSRHGFRGATLDLIAQEAGLSKPNILYYFEGKEDIHLTLLARLLETWLDPLVTLDENGEPLAELLGYVQRKLDMAHELPRESRLFAGEILRGAPHMGSHLKSDLKPLFDQKCAVIQKWVDEGAIAPVNPAHLIFSIWSTTQHYADFDAQVQVLLGDSNSRSDAREHLGKLFTALLTPPSRH